MATEATLHIITSCTERKRAPISPELYLGRLEADSLAMRASLWWTRLTAPDGRPRTIARDLYCGEHWSLALRAFATLAAAGRPARLWVASAGYGLIPDTAEIRAYSSTFAGDGAASVSRGSLDGGSRIIRLQAWWRYLCCFSAPGLTAPRSLRELARAAPKSALLVVASPDYIRAMQPDLLVARDTLATPDRLTIISNHVLSTDPALAPHLIPVDDRCRTVLGGTMQGLNARVAISLLQTDHAASMTASRLREQFDKMVKDAERPITPHRERMSDDDVLAFLRAALVRDPRAGWTQLLRTLRSSGRACEQARFRELHQRTQEALTRR